MKRVEMLVESEDRCNLPAETLHDNYGYKTAIKNAHCIAPVTMTKPQHTAIALHAFYDNNMSDIRSLKTLDQDQDQVWRLLFQHC